MTGDVQVGTVSNQNRTWGAVKALYSVNDPLEALSQIEH